MATPYCILPRVANHVKKKQINHLFSQNMDLATLSKNGNRKEPENPTES